MFAIEQFAAHVVYFSNYSSVSVWYFHLNILPELLHMVVL